MESLLKTIAIFGNPIFLYRL